MASLLIVACAGFFLANGLANRCADRPAHETPAPESPDARKSGDDGAAVLAKLWIVAFDESVPDSELPLGQEVLARIGRGPSEKGRIPTWGLAVQQSVSEFSIKCQEHALRVQDGKLVMVSPDSPKAPDAPWEIVSAPQLVVLFGQEAAVQVGRPVAHLEKGADDCLRVVTWPEHVEGASIQLTPEQLRPDGIRFEGIRVSVTRIESRAPVDGVPLDVGRPVFDTRETALDLTLPPDKIAMIPLPGRAGEPALFAFLMASVVKP